MAKFLQLLKEIFENLPLVLSDSDSPKDVSLNRIIIVMAVLGLSMMLVVVPVFFPQWFDKVMPLWTQLLTFLGAQIAGNMFKKVMLDKQLKQAGEVITNKIDPTPDVKPTNSKNLIVVKD